MEREFEFYSLYDANKTFMTNLKKKIDEFGITSQKIWPKTITNENKNDFMKTYKLINSKIVHYNKKIKQFYTNSSSNITTPEISQVNTDNMRNANIKDVIVLLMDIFFKSTNKNNTKSKKWLDYWQIFGMLLLIFDNKKSLKDLYNLDKEYDYKLYQNISKILKMNYPKLKMYMPENCTIGNKNLVCPTLFRYLKTKYCSTNNKNTSKLLTQKCEEEIHQLKIGKNISETCGYLAGKNKDQCSSNILCEYIIYCTSKKELNNYQNIINKMVGYMILYYNMLANQYYQVAYQLQDKGYATDFMTQSNYNDLSKIEQPYINTEGL